MELETILTIVLSIVTLFAGGYWLKAKGKLSLLAALVKETYEVITVLLAALEDDKITKEEMDLLKDEANDVKTAWQKLFGLNKA